MTRTCEHSDAGRAAAIELSKALSPPKSRGRRVRRSTPGCLAAFRRGVADCHSEDAPIGCQGDEILEHSFVPMRRGVRQGWTPPNRVRQSCCPFSYLEAAIFGITSTGPGRAHPGSIDSRHCLRSEVGVKWTGHVERVASRSIRNRPHRCKNSTAHALASTGRARIQSSRDARSTIIALHAQGQPGRAVGQALDDRLHPARIGIAGKVTPAVVCLASAPRRAVADQALHRGTDVHDIAGCKQQRHVLMRHVSQRYGARRIRRQFVLTKVKLWRNAHRHPWCTNSALMLD